MHWLARVSRRRHAQRALAARALPHDAAAANFDALVQRSLGISSRVFVQRLNDGEYIGTTNSQVVDLAVLAPAFAASE